MIETYILMMADMSWRILQIKIIFSIVSALEQYV